jgi:trimeric autotransporter adhesin
MLRTLFTGAAALALMGSSAGAMAAGALPHVHIKGYLRVDHATDLRGAVRARKGLRVQNGVSTDSFTSTGTVRVGGILTVAGQATTAGLNAGSGAIVTTGALQGGSLAVSGDENVAGNIIAGKTLTAAGGTFGPAGIHSDGAIQATSGAFGPLVASALTAGTVSASGGVTATNITATGAVSGGSLSTGGAVNAGSITTGGALSAGSIGTNGSVSAANLSASGSVTGGTGTFGRLNVQSNGAVNFNGATVSGLSGLTLQGSALSANTLTLTTSGAGGQGGTSAIILRQGGRQNTLSVNPAGELEVGGAQRIRTDLTVDGNLAASRISSPSGISLSTPFVATTGTVTIQGGGDLNLQSSSSLGPSHLVGNTDTRGVCTASAVSSGVNTCSVTFHAGYSSVPIVVASPAGSDPSEVTGFAVHPTTGGFTIAFTVKSSGAVSFTYIVEG